MDSSLPPLNALRAFSVCARWLSVTRAADELCVTHGAVSRQLKSLEAWLGVALVEKNGRGIKLTDAGRSLQHASDLAFEQLRQCCTELREQQRNAPLVLACPGSFLARWFIPRLDRLQRELPQLRLQLSASEGALNPVRADVSATLCFAEPPWPQAVQRFDLAGELLGPLLSPRHPRFAELSRSPLAALLNEPLLHTSSRPQAWPQWAAAVGFPAAELKLGQGFEHLYYLLEAALAGLGVAIAPQLLVSEDLAAGRLVAPWGFVASPARLSLFALQDRQGQVAQLAQWLKQELAQ